MYLSNGVSVIIPTYNRAELLNLTLKSLQLQTCDRNNYEVIVIDDGSIDDTKGIVTSFGDSLDVHYLHQEHQGFRVARARNLGIASARFNVCLFLDSGVLAAPELIDIHLNAHIRYAKPIAYVGYANGFDEFNESSFSSDFNFNSQVDLRRVFQGVSKRHEYIDCRIMGLQKLGIDFDEIKIPWLLFWTCHASCSTTALRTVNGFDEVFQSWGGGRC